MADNNYQNEPNLYYQPTGNDNSTQENQNNQQNGGQYNEQCGQPFGQYYQQPNGQYNQQPDNQYYQMPVQPTEQKASVGLAILSFFIPIAGLIIFLVDKDKRPKTAKTSGICALVSFILNIILSIIITVGYGALFSKIMDEYDGDPSAIVSEFIEGMEGLDDGEYIEGANGSDDGNFVADDVIGDYVCVAASSEYYEDEEGKNIILVTYKFTNNSVQAVTFDEAIEAKAYQYSNQTGSLLENITTDETVGGDIAVAPGESGDVTLAYILQDTVSDVEFEYSDKVSGDKSSAVFALS